MYCRVIACDFDGTGATDGRPAPELYAALASARAQGIVTLLVTGRVLEDVQRACEDLSPFDAVVAENGAVIYLCELARTIQIGEPPPERFLGELRSQGVPFHTGAVIVGTWEQHAGKLLELIRRFGIDGQMIFNRAALMLLPSGINKAVGVRRALNELGRSERNMVAFGDAENDIPMLINAEVAVAARAAIPAVLTLADDAVSQPGGAGVARYIRRLIEQGGFLPNSPRRFVTLGKSRAGAAVTLPSSGTNLLISGDPRSGKSWIAGLLAEQLIEAGYRIVIIDPEGDYARMGERSNVITFGHDLELPSPPAAARLLRTEPVSIVFILAVLKTDEQIEYVNGLLAALQEVRAVSGMPHWIMIDEAHYFFNEKSPCLRHLDGANGNICLTTYRPSLLAREAYDTIGAHLFTSTKVEEERYFVTQILQAYDGLGVEAHAALDALNPPWAGLLVYDRAICRWQLFVPSERFTAHAHHARKYADVRLPEGKAFRFQNTEDALTAYNIKEFYSAIQTAPAASLRHHLIAGDFSRWVGEVIGDQQLAKGLRKLERAIGAGAMPGRAEILAHIADHYIIDQGSS